MGHQSRNQSKNTESGYMSSGQNYPGGDSSGRLYLSPSPRAISSGIMYLGRSALVFLGAFVVALLSASAFTPVTNSDAKTDVTTIIRNSGTYAQITAPSQMVLNLESTTSGATVIGSQTVTTKTNSENGYRLFVSTGSTDADSQKMVKSDDADAISHNYYLSPLSTSSPTTFTAASVNTWGYTLDNLYGNTAGETVTSSSYFKGMPLRGNDDLIREVTSATSDSSGNVTDSTKANTTVYYGAKATTNLPSGEYVSTVVYTAVVESNTTDLSVIPSRVSRMAGGSDFTIVTPIYMAENMNLGTISVTVGGKAATDCARTLVDNSMAVVLTCKTPAQDYVGDYDIAVSFSGYSGSKEDALLYYVPWENLEYMQDMTTYACQEDVETPAAFADGSTTPVYAYGPKTVSNTDNTIKTDSTINTSSATADWTTYATANYASFGYIANINKGVPEKQLTDLRDGSTYRVRKLADGNCWMTENLRLVFSDDNGTIGYVNASGTISAKGSVTYTRSYDSSTVTVSANHKIDETLSNVGKNAVGGSSSWTSSSNSTFGYTEIINTGATATNSIWGSETRGKHPSSGSVAWDATHSDISMDYARSLYNGATRNDCTKADVANSGANDCFIKDGDTQTIGTYYNWKAATAGVGDLTNTSRNDSICPSGWQLPVNGDSTTDKSYAKLINGTYGNGIASGNNIDARNNSSDSGVGSGTDYYHTLAGYHIWALTAQMRMAPLSIPFSGYYYWGGTVYNVGLAGNFWSGTASGTSTARHLGAYAGYLYPQLSNDKGYGFAVRCVAQ